MKKIILTTMFLMFFAIFDWAQTRTVTGQVLSLEKDTIIAALVKEKCTSNATITDLNGNFSLFVSDRRNVIDLYFEFPGYLSLLLRQVPITNYKVNLPQILLKGCKFINIESYGRLNESEQKKWNPEYCWGSLLGYQYCELENSCYEIKCASDTSIVNKFEFDKMMKCMIIEFKNYKSCP